MSEGKQARAPRPQARLIDAPTAQAVVTATKKRRKARTKKLGKNAGKKMDKLAKSTAEDLQRLMALRAAPYRDSILEMQERFNKTTDPVEKSALGQQLTYERLRQAHHRGVI
jgi:hypothetical protein